MNTDDDKSNKVTVFELPANIFNLCTKNLKENQTDTVIEVIKQQNFEKIPNVDNAFTYFIQDYNFSERQKSSPSGFRQECSLEKYFELSSIQHKNKFVKINDNNEEEIDCIKETFSNYINSKDSVEALYAPDINTSFTASIAQNIPNFDLTTIDKKLVGFSSLDEKHGLEEEIIVETKPDDNKIKVEGIHTPFVYLGSCGSCFPVHIEDSNLSSINVQLEGCPKIWFSIKRESVIVFEQIVNLLLLKQPDANKKCKYPIRHKTLLF